MFVRFEILGSNHRRMLSKRFYHRDRQQILHQSDMLVLIQRFSFEFRDSMQRNNLKIENINQDRPFSIQRFESTQKQTSSTSKSFLIRLLTDCP